MSTWSVIGGRSRPCAVCEREMQRFEKGDICVDCLRRASTGGEQ